MNGRAYYQCSCGNKKEFRSRSLRMEDYSFCRVCGINTLWKRDEAKLPEALPKKPIMVTSNHPILHSRFNIKIDYEKIAFQVIDQQQDFMPRNAYKYWNPKMDEELKHLISTETHYKDVANLFGRSEGAIRARVERIMDGSICTCGFYVPNSEHVVDPRDMRKKHRTCLSK